MMKGASRQRVPRFFILLLIICAVRAEASWFAPADTLAARSDTSIVRRDTAAVRDTAAAIKSPSGIDTVVIYSATDSIVYSLSSKTMYLFGKSSIKNKDLGLKAENIDINWNTSLLNAVGVVDTADTSGLRHRGTPELIDGNETYRGDSIAYNFKSKKGKINLGKTEIEKGLYYGEEIKKEDADVLFVQDGKFTTCDLDHPHYYFGSPEMKVLVRDKVVARPLFLYIADVPVFALPFGIFPSERGRRSGLIAPAFGESFRGRYLTHLGYYWAINDYMDLAVKGDGYTRGSYALYSDFRYALRYNFSGGLSASYGKVISGEAGDPGYGVSNVFNVHMGHNQDFNPTTRLTVDFTFTSGSYYQQTSNNYNDLLRQNVISNATLTKSWEGTPNSMTLNIRRDQNLQTGQINDVLPNISFNRSLTYPFRSKRSSGSLAWYELLGYSYSGQFLNVHNKTPLDSVNFAIDDRQGVSHQISLNASPKLGYITITPFFNYSERWYDKHIQKTFNPADSSVSVEDIKGFKAVRYYNLGVSASTRLFGILQPGIFGIKGIRHQVIPSISYTYQPDFSKSKYGYFDTYRDASGTLQQYSIFEKEVFGGAPAGEQQAISMSLGNVFEMKTAADDTSGKENKIQLLNVGLGLSYNFAADNLKFSELGMDFRTNIAQVVSIGGSTRFNLYKFVADPTNPYAGHRINKFLINEEGRLAQMTSFNVSIGTQLRGEKKKTQAGPIRSQADSIAKAQKGGYIGLYDQDMPDFSIPWNLDLNWSYSQSTPGDPALNSRSSNISIGLGLNLTEFWKITASASYDIFSKQFAAPHMTIYRDLHCWEMNFDWVPTGPYRNFRLEIKLKAPQLQDVKVTKQSSARGIY